MKKRGILLGTILMLIMVIGFQPPVHGAEQKINFGYLVADQLHNPAPMIMKHKKLLEAEGLKVKWGEFLAGAYLMQHLSSGEVDFGTCGAVPTMITRGRGVNVVVLAGSNTEGSAIIVVDSIKKIEDLNGKKIGTPGIGSIQDAMVSRVARQYNMKIYHKHMKVSDMPIFLKKGEIDGFIAWAPHPERAVDLGYGHILLTSNDMLEGHQCCVLVSKGELLGKDPQTVKKVVRAYMKAWKFYRENPDETIDMMVKATGLSKNVVQMGLKTVQHPYPPYVNIASMNIMAEGLVEGGKIQKGVITNTDKFVAEIYHPEFLMEYIRKEMK